MVQRALSMQAMDAYESLSEDEAIAHYAHQPHA